MLEEKLGKVSVQSVRFDFRNHLLFSVSRMRRRRIQTRKSGGKVMTYKDFIESIREQADYIERFIKDSQIVKLNDELSEDDTILDLYEDCVEELMANATGKYGWHIEYHGMR
jgi:hypothetical protein